jgi:hypothetical protein
MKKLILIFLLASSVQQVYCQDILNLDSEIEDSILNLDIKEKKITATINANGKSKSEIYSSINRWVSVNYNSANNVIQMNDKEAGIMIVKGLNTLIFNNPTRSTYPKTKAIPLKSELLLSHLLEIKVRDNKYRLIYTITGIVETTPLNTMYSNPNTYDCINLNGTTDESIAKFNNFWKEEYFKKSMMSKKKRVTYLSFSKPIFDKINTELALSFVSNFTSINKMVNETSDDDW